MCLITLRGGTRDVAGVYAQFTALPGNSIWVGGGRNDVAFDEANMSLAVGTSCVRRIQTRL